MLSQEARGFLLDNPDQFITHYFPERVSRLQDFHLRLLDSAAQKRALILYPAEHGKTTLVSILLPIHAACVDPNIRIGIIAKNDAEANNISQTMQAEMMANETLVEDFGPFKPQSDDSKSWAVGKMTVDKRTVRAKEPTFQFFGSGSKHVLGHRTNWTICDDVVTDMNSSSPTQRESLRGWFNKSARTMNLPDGRITVVGTRFDPNDLYGDLMELYHPESGERIWPVQWEDAIVDEEKRLPLWPEWWSWKDLMIMKAEMGTLDFNKRLRNIAVDPSRMVFREEYITGGWIGKVKYDGCIDRQYTVGDYDPSWRRVAGFDPAVGTTRSAKFCAHVTLAAGSCARHERCLWVVDLLRDQLSLPQQIDQILVQHQKYELLKSVVEANSYQAGLLDAIKLRMQETGLAFNIEPHVTDRVNKHDPEIGIQSLSPRFENGEVHIPYGNPESMRKMQIFIDELIQYPDYRTSDTVMAFWFAAKQLQVTGPKYKSSNYLKRPLFTNRTPGRRVVKNPYYEKLEA